MSVQLTSDPHDLRGANWHAMTVDEVTGALAADTARGLSAAEAAARHARYGPNALRSAPPTPWWNLLLGQFTDGLILVLLGAALLSLLIGEVEEAVFIAVLLVFNGVLGFWQERQAQRSLAAVQGLVVPRARVRRDGAVQQVPSDQLVPGDLVLLEAGDTVPADGRLVAAFRLAVAEAALTGEAVPVDKDTRPVGRDTALADRTGMAFTHTAITAGRAELVVTATGMDTEIGKLATLMSEVEPEPTPLQRQTSQLGHRLALIAGAAVLGLLVVGLVQGSPLHELVVGAIALAVAAIPEALPATVTVTLAVGMSRLAQRRAVVKRLHAVETLGSTSIICSDKTGTLTLNQMTVRTLVRGDEELSVDGQGYAPDGRIGTTDLDGRPTETRQLAAVMALCNDAVVRDGACIGDPTEGALVVLAGKAGIDVAGARQRFPRVGEVPFDSATKYMATFHEDRSGEQAGEVVICVKGAVESVLERVTHLADRRGDPVALDVKAFGDLAIDLYFPDEGWGATSPTTSA